MGLPATQLHHPATCAHAHGFGVYQRLNRYDPTRTLTLRNAFVREMAKRFRALRGVIRKAIVAEDCFGLTRSSGTRVLITQARFDFPRSQDKVTAFMAWLDQQVQSGILETTTIARIGGVVETAWTDRFITDSYKRGVIRARDEMVKAEFDVPRIADTGGVEASLAAPLHADRLGLLYTRTFTGLKGITAAMDHQLSQVLAQGIADGDNPRLLAKILNATISGPVGDLGITDTLGRFIPAERRAAMLARTEVIRAHHQATIQEYRNWSVAGVTVQAEWVTAGFNVCPECAALEGRVFTLEEIEGKIPVHPNCRCVTIPANPLEPGKIPSGPEAVAPLTWGDMRHTERIGSLLDLKKILINKYGIDDLKFSWGVGEAETIAKGNLIAKYMGEIYHNLPELSTAVRSTAERRGLINLRVVSLHKGKFVKYKNIKGESRGTIGLYSPKTRKIDMSGLAMRKTERELSLGWKTYITGEDFGSVFRHEYGHHLAEVQGKDWVDWIIFHSSHGKNFFGEHVSSYAATSPGEAWAECFSAYSSPLYGSTPRRTFPRDLEDMMVRIFGKRRGE